MGYSAATEWTGLQFTCHSYPHLIGLPFSLYWRLRYTIVGAYLFRGQPSAYMAFSRPITQLSDTLTGFKHRLCPPHIAATIYPRGYSMFPHQRESFLPVMPPHCPVAVLTLAEYPAVTDSNRIPHQTSANERESNPPDFLPF